MSDPADGPRIRELSNGVPGGLQGLVDLFISHTSEARADLRKAADEGRVVDVQLLAHRGAGTAGAFGAGRLLELFREIEAAARQNASDAIAPLVAALEQELARVHLFLETLVARADSGDGPDRPA
jgi:HPt (histidine-containing phosphotransfer) domain-containing protein